MISNDPQTPSVLVRPWEAFGPLPLVDGVAPVTIRTTVGELTGLHAEPVAAARGTVLFVPGFTGSKEDFLPLLPLLAAQGWDVWAYSQRGQADSVAPEGHDAYRLEDFAADACEVADIVGGGAPVHLVGHSFGGLVARAAALRSPQAFADVVLLCSGPRGFGSSKDDLRSIVDESGSLGLWANANPALAELPATDLEPYDAYRRLRAELTSPDNLRAIMDVLWDTTDRTVELRETGLPVLVAHGATDDAWPQAWQKEMAEVLDAPYRVIPDAGHCPAEENPAATATLLGDYWDERLED